jgi:hypothetical protein
MKPDMQSEADFLGMYKSKEAITFEVSTGPRELKFTDFQKFAVKFPEPEYHTVWGSFIAPFSVVADAIEAHPQWEVTPTDKTSGYATGNTADAILYYCLYNVTGYEDSGAVDGSFDKLLNYKNQGIGLPSALKTALGKEKGNSPLLGIFGVTVQGQTEQIVVVFHSKRTK